MILFKKRGVRIGEVWFDEQSAEINADLIFYLQQPTPVANSFVTPKQTILVDIRRDINALFSDCNKGCQYEIRRSRDRDGVCCYALDSHNLEVMTRFQTVYDKFANTKGLEKLDFRHFRLLVEADALDISTACDKEGNPLVYHAYLAQPPRSRLLYSVSLFRAGKDSQRRNLFGRANRYLHWEDMLRFKQAGYTKYDWGGWCPDKSNVARQQINRFKEEFGGIVIKEWDCEKAITVKGRLALIYRLLCRKV
jgi:hypothetical protein